jgi:hypothetical protein
MLGLYRRFMDLDYVYASLLKYILDRKLSKKEKKKQFLATPQNGETHYNKIKIPRSVTYL